MICTLEEIIFLFSYSRLDTEYIFKQINIYLQWLPKINHQTLPTFSSLVQGPAVLGFIYVGLQPVCSLRIGQLDNLYSGVAIIDSVSLFRHNMYRFSSNGFGVAQCSDMQYTDTELDH
jgi:hypothetical protein